jgi:hypothetical protein
VGGSQLLKLIRGPVIALLSQQVGPTPSLRAFLESEAGEALLCGVLSLMLSTISEQEEEDELPERLAREMRVRAMTGLHEQMMGILTGLLRQVGAPPVAVTTNALQGGGPHASMR